MTRPARAEVAPDARPKKEVLRDIKRISKRIAALEELYDDRNTLYYEAWKASGATHAEIAEAAGSTEGAVAQVCRKIRRSRAA